MYGSFRSQVAGTIRRGQAVPGLCGRCRRGNARLTLLAETPSRGLPAPGRRDMFARPRQAEARHVVVDRLVPAGLHEIGLVPDPDRAVRSDRAIEALPGLE